MRKPRPRTVTMQEMPLTQPIPTFIVYNPTDAVHTGDLCAYCLQIATEPRNNVQMRVHTDSPLIGQRIKLPNNNELTITLSTVVDDADDLQWLARIYGNEVRFTYHGGQTLPVWAVTFRSGSSVCISHNTTQPFPHL